MVVTDQGGAVVKIAGKNLSRWWLLVPVVLIIGAVAVFAVSGGGKGLSLSLGSGDKAGKAGSSAGKASSTGGKSGSSDGAARSTATTKTAGSGSTGGSGSQTNQASSSGGSSGGQNSSGNGKPGAKTVYVVVKYWNDCERQQPDELQLVLGDASWKPKGEESQTGKIGPLAVGKTSTLVVYPDGPKGSKLVAKILFRKDMVASDRDAVHVEIRDERIRVLGNPVVGFEVVSPRG